MKRMTFDGNFCVIAMCMLTPGGSYCEDGACSQRKAWERLKAIEDILGDEYDLDRLCELAQADREGRCVVLPAKTVFELTWDAGPECDMACPICIDGEGGCDFCDKGKLFVYERPCKQEYIKRIGEDVFLTRAEAEAALRREQDGNRI